MRLFYLAVATIMYTLYAILLKPVGFFGLGGVEQVLPHLWGIAAVYCVVVPDEPPQLRALSFIPIMFAYEAHYAPTVLTEDIGLFFIRLVAISLYPVLSIHIAGVALKRYINEAKMVRGDRMVLAVEIITAVVLGGVAWALM